MLGVELHGCTVSAAKELTQGTCEGIEYTITSEFDFYEVIKNPDYDYKSRPVTSVLVSLSIDIDNLPAFYKTSAIKDDVAFSETSKFCKAIKAKFDSRFKDFKRIIVTNADEGVKRLMFAQFSFDTEGDKQDDLSIQEVMKFIQEVALFVRQLIEFEIDFTGDELSAVEKQRRSENEIRQKDGSSDVRGWDLATIEL